MAFTIYQPWPWPQAPRGADKPPPNAVVPGRGMEEAPVSYHPSISFLHLMICDVNIGWYLVSTLNRLVFFQQAPRHALLDMPLPYMYNIYIYYRIYIYIIEYIYIFNDHPYISNIQLPYIHIYIYTYIFNDHIYIIYSMTIYIYIYIHSIYAFTILPWHAFIYELNLQHSGVLPSGWSNCCSISCHGQVPVSEAMWADRPGSRATSFRLDILGFNLI